MVVTMLRCVFVAGRGERGEVEADGGQHGRLRMRVSGINKTRNEGNGIDDGDFTIQRLPSISPANSVSLTKPSACNSNLQP